MLRCTRLWISQTLEKERTWAWEIVEAKSANQLIINYKIGWRGVWKLVERQLWKTGWGRLYFCLAAARVPSQFWYWIDMNLDKISRPLVFSGKCEFIAGKLPLIRTDEICPLRPDFSSLVISCKPRLCVKHYTAMKREKNSNLPFP